MSLPLALTVMIGLVADPSAQDYPRGHLLVDPADLAKPEVAEQFRVLDARGKNQYAAGHIPGAVWVDHFSWSRISAVEQNKEAWAKRIGGLGIGVTTKVVVYDDAGFRDAARIWWILRYWGVQDARLLNGGWQAWAASSGKVSTEESKAVTKEPKISSQTERLAQKEQLLQWLAGKRVQIVDTRSVAEYCGEEGTAKRKGAIPGAIHLEWVEFIDPKTQRLKSREDLAKLLRQAGVDADKPVVTYCQSGGRAAVTAFALELMGGKEVRNYYRSWAEWGNVEDTPIEKPKLKP